MKYYFEKNFDIPCNKESFEYDDNMFSYSELISGIDYNKATNILTEDIILVGDVNVYNKTELKEKYLIYDSKNLLIDMYKLAGLSFLNDINGEYSFVLYDRKKEIIYLVTDHMGINTLFWTVNNQSINFGTDLFLLYDCFDIKNLNKKYFKEYYNNFGQVNNYLTPYKGVNRVEKGSYISISTKIFKIKYNKYWQLELDSINIKYDKEEDYIYDFTRILRESISNRLLKNDRDAVMMSGGLDSTSTYALANTMGEENIVPLSGVFDKLDSCDERLQINKVLDMYKDIGQFVVCDDCGMLSGYPEGCFYTYEPHVNALTSKFTASLISTASNLGIENMLTGYAADHLLGGSLIRVLDDLKLGKIKESLGYIKEISTMTNQSFLGSLISYVLKPLFTKNKLIDFDEKLCSNHKNNINNIKSYNQKQLYLQLANVCGFKYSDREIAPRHNIRIKHPFLDKKLIEYIYRIPGKFRSNIKYDKFILREAVQDILPKEIISKLYKTQHVELTFSGINNNWNEIYTKIKNFRLGELNLVDINIEQWTKELGNFRGGGTVREDFYVLLSLELWLSQYYDFLK